MNFISNKLNSLIYLSSNWGRKNAKYVGCMKFTAVKKWNSHMILKVVNSAVGMQNTWYWLLTYGRKKGHKNFVFWVGNCSAQNKNWFLFTALCTYVNKTTSTVDSISLKLGHTFMSADSFHHEVEKGMNLKKNIYDFKDFVKVIKSCGKTILIQPDDFLS